MFFKLILDDSVKKNCFKNSRGFTLIEMLLVLTIIGIITSIVCHVTLSISEKRNIDQFFNQLIFDIQNMQALAIKEEEKIAINFNSSNAYYAYYDLKDEKIITRTYPEGVKLNNYSNLKLLLITSNGNISKFGTLIFNTPYGERKLIVYIQEGRLRLVE